MTSDPYVPLPGTIAARVLAWFAQQAPECEASSGVIADALGQPIAAVITALEPVFERGLIAREKRDGRLYWSTHHRRPRPLGSPPPVIADDDEPDDFPLIQRTAAATGRQETAVNKPADAPPQPKTRKPRASPAIFDPLAIELKPGRPLPSTTHTPGPSRYRILLDRMKSGDSVDLPTAVAKGLVSAAKRAQVKVAARVLNETTTGVWRL